MRWTERQRAMLAEMGIRLWTPVDAEAAAGTDAVTPSGDAAGPTASAVEAVGAPPAVAARDVTPAPTAPPVLPPTSVARVALLPAAPVVVRRPSPDTAAVPAAHAAAGGVAAMDWSELRSTVAGCTACPLHTGRRQTVFGFGHPGAHWMIVGEAPGEEEDRRGEPFVGKSGQLLDNMLRAIGLSRHAAASGEVPPVEGDAVAPGDPARQVYIANTVKCRPPGNRNPEPDELAQCEAYLQRQVTLVRPRIILAMGRFAVQQLLRSDEPVGRLRGRVHRYEGVPLVVTYHPAYLLRNLQDKARAWDDLCLAVETLAAADAPRASSTAPD